MNSLAINNNSATQAEKTRSLIEGEDPTVLTGIYQEDCNIAIWKRGAASELQEPVKDFLKANSNFQTSMTVSPQSALASVSEALGNSEATALLSQDIADLVDMFCCLFELKRVGLRLRVLNSAMCPKFHVDRVPCRLVTTYQGAGTEWLPHHSVDRTKLGHGSEGKPDEESGLFQTIDDIHQLEHGDVALLKGESWEGNEDAGLVHRSPTILSDKPRLLLTLDFN